MKMYLITYDLNKEGTAYTKTRENIVKALQKAGEVLHIATTTYVLKTQHPSASHVFDAALKPYLDGNDRAMITQMCTDHSGWLSKDQWNFIHSGTKCCRY